MHMKSGIYVITVQTTPKFNQRAGCQRQFSNIFGDSSLKIRINIIKNP